MSVLNLRGSWSPYLLSTPIPKPFYIAVSDADLERLHQKLDAATFPDELDHADWDREQEQNFNEQLKQFTMSVSMDGFEDLNIHYLHHTSKTPGAIPLLFLHGWLGSFIEVTKLIPLLTSGDDSKPAFERFGLHQYAEAMHGIMTALGYKEYVIQGGDWGSFIDRTRARKIPRPYKAIQLNFIPICFPMPWQSPGYFIQQATRPQTLTDDEILPWVSIYLFSTAGPAASTRIYYESSEDGSVVSATEYPRGGHFAPWEVPDLLVGDLKEFLWSDGSGFRGCGRE
ncbi:Alpha/Beta hydrolase protein [Aspergillus cavernicola]|uniref:Alpha/Beta hydrolase protein n=1 Tax=Aspergillus cavernicola TaxID=176166 RepID=A0ABR4J052_9EURO